ncbi:hypothetical protein HJ01_00724 [Flavobacterium frigoris PS1]|uniref:Uncharacterized protein n=1 Tax=Flavobacterium frigoris (strain PS1) TaxID=1086011 RepID=H7FNQ2_FLAFP|nr:hypothetical protein HJ01_00724 [Flavobacterium frigoris PS1]
MAASILYCQTHFFGAGKKILRTAGADFIMKTAYCAPKKEITESL